MGSLQIMFTLVRQWEFVNQNRHKMLKPGNSLPLFGARQLSVNIISEKPIVGKDFILVLARRWETGLTLPTFGQRKHMTINV